MNGQSDSSCDPAHQLAQDDHPATEKDNYRPGLPDQSVDELVQLHTGHAQICCEFRAKETTDAGGVVEISRWCKPPVAHTNCDKPREGRRNGVARFARPLPGLGFCVRVEPVVCTTG